MTYDPSEKIMGMALFFMAFGWIIGFAIGWFTGHYAR
jgi:hypothetical protein